MTFVGLPTWIVVSLLAGTAAVLAALHFLRTRPRPLRVNTTIFWAEALQASRASSLMQRFRHLLTYLLLLAICFTIILAIGRPVVDTDGTRRQSVMVVLDGGASMGAMLDESSPSEKRFDRAKQETLKICSQLFSGDDLAVIVADPQPRLLHRFDEPKAVLARQIASLEPAELPADRRAALRLASDLARGRSGAKIVVITDRAFADGEFNQYQNGETPIEVVRVGQPLTNAAILAAMFEPAAADPLSGTFRLRVGHWDRQPDGQAKNIRVIVKRSNGAVLLDELRAFTPGQTTAEFSIAALPADGQTLSVRIEGDDALAADSHLEFRLPRRRQIRVALPVESPQLLRALLESDAAVTIVAPGETADLTVSNGTTEPSADSTTTGPTIVIFGRSQDKNSTGTNNIAVGVSVETAGNSPLVDGLDFESGVCFPGIDPRNLPPQASPLLSAGRSILAAIETQASHKTLWICETLLDPKATVTRRAALPVFISRAVRNLADWQTDPLVLSPSQSFIAPCLSTAAELDNTSIVMPADRLSANLSAASSSINADERPTDLSNTFSAIELFELLLLSGLCLMVCESLLHARGRIS